MGSPEVQDRDQGICTVAFSGVRGAGSSPGACGQEGVISTLGCLLTLEAECSPWPCPAFLMSHPDSLRKRQWEVKLQNVCSNDTPAR